MQKESKEYMVNAQSGKSFRVRKGDSIQIIDIEGKQVADFWAIRDDHLDEFFSPGVTLKTAMNHFTSRKVRICSPISIIPCS